MNTLLSWVKEIGLSGLFDIAVMSLLIYSILVWMKRTRRAAAILAGILIVAVGYLLARQFNLFLTVAVLQGFFAIILIALVVIFQEELRYFFERVAQWSVAGRRKPGSSSHRLTDLLVKTLSDLGRDRIGALIVLRNKDLLVRHLEGGDDLNGKVSEKVLKSIFDTHSAGHDGAVVIDRDVIESFGCHLPLSRQHDKLGRTGTRHAAALGLSELTDALCLVVSEERGTISTARHGEITRVDEEQLGEVLDAFYREAAAPATGRGWRDFFSRNSREKLLAIGMALALWFVLVHEANIVYKRFVIPVEYPQIEADLRVTRLEPNEVHVTLSGPRKAFFLLGPREVRLMLKPWDVGKGRRTVSITPSDLTFPDDLAIENIEPRQISIAVAEVRSDQGKD